MVGKTKIPFILTWRQQIRSPSSPLTCSISVLIISADTFEPLDEYVKHLPKVKVLRQDSRMGLIRARLAGAAYSKGEVITLSLIYLLIRSLFLRRGSKFVFIYDTI